MLTLRNRFRSLLGALFCLFFISFGVPVSQAMTDDEQITQWINENYVSLLRLSQAEVLSSYDSAVFPDFTVETPRIVANFAEDAASGSGYSLDINGEYVAVISNPDGLPILLLNFVKQGSEITDGKILEDPKLAERIFSFTEGTVIVHDLPTKAWYRIIADKIEAIDAGGEKVLLGSLPVLDFLQQRSRLLGVGVESLEALPDTVPDVNTVKNGQRQLVKMFWGLAAGGLLLLSISWLAWERRELAKREFARKREKLTLPESAQWREVDGQEHGARLSFRQAARRITTYRKRSTATSAETQVKAETQVVEAQEEKRQDAEGLE